MSEDPRPEALPPVPRTRHIFIARQLGFTPVRADAPVLADLSLEMAAAEVLAVVGRQNSGAEYLRDMVLGIPIAGSGSGTLTIGSNWARIPRLAYMPGPADAALAPHVSVARQLVHVLARRAQISHGAAREDLRRTLERLDGAPTVQNLEALPKALGARALAMAFLAAALAQNPDAVIANDSTSGLDPTEREGFLSLLLQQRARDNFALLYFTGDPTVAARLGGRIAVLRDGRLVDHGPVDRIASADAQAYTQTLFRSVPRVVPPATGPQPELRSEPLLQVRNFSFGGRADGNSELARGLTFEVRKGGSLAVIGVEGSGRRGLVRAVLGLDAAPQGRVIFDAVDMGVLSATMRARLRRRIGFLSSDRDVLDPRMTVAEVIAEPMRSQVNLGKDENKRTLNAVLTRVGLRDVPLGRIVADIGPLNLRRLQVARILAAAPQLVVVIEPLRGLDALGQALMLDMLKTLRARESVAYLLITADFAVAQALSDNALVMANGQIVETGPVSEMLRNPRDLYTKVLVEAVFQAPAPSAALPSPDPES